MSEKERSDIKSERDINDSEELPIEQKEINLAQQKWEKASAETEKIEDSLGCSVDENIKETVTAFNIFDINTTKFSNM